MNNRTKLKDLGFKPTDAKQLLLHPKKKSEITFLRTTTSKGMTTSIHSTKIQSQ